jgi:hypothetical protein
MKPAAYVILEWLDATPPYPRYSFATVSHASELGPEVRWLEPCPQLEVAADLVARLNGRDRDWRYGGGPETSVRMS